MNAPDYDFWRAERVRVLSGSFRKYREDIEVGAYLNAIDVILETEATIHDLRVQVVRLEDIITDHLERLEKTHDEYALARKAELE